MKTYELNTYQKIKSLCQLTRYYNNQNDCITLFRGTKTSFLSPSILIDSKYTFSELSDKEDRIHQEFYENYKDTINEDNVILKDWKLRVMGREHELRNRLMDWSNTFYNSVDFSTYSTSDFPIQDKFTYLWILSIESNFKKEINNLQTLPFQEINESFVFNGIGNYSLPHTRRQLIQGGFFLVQPSNLITIKINEQPFFNNRLIRIKIPVGNINTIRKDLSRIENTDLTKSLMIEDSPIDKFCRASNRKAFSG